MSITAIPQSAASATTAVTPTSGAQNGTTVSALATPQPATNQTTGQTPQALAVSAAALVAAARQSGLSTLLADLGQALANPATPSPVQAAASQVLALQTPLDPPPDAADLQQATAQSGLFLEANLANGAAPVSDLKAALLIAQQVLQLWSDSAAAQEPAVTTQTAQNSTTQNPSGQNPSAQTPLPQAAPAPPGLAQTGSGSTGSDPGGNPNPGSNPSPAPQSSALSANPANASLPAAQAPGAPTPPANTTSEPVVPAPPSQTANQTPATTPTASAPAEAGISPSSTPAVTPQGAAPAQNPSTTSPSGVPAPAQAAPNPPQAQTPAQAAAQPAAASPQAPAPQPIASVVLAALAATSDIQAEAAPTPSSASASTGPAAPQTSAPNTQASAPAPPFRAGPTAAQPPATSTLAPNAEPAAAARQLLTAVNGAVARQELHQIASLPDTPAAAPQSARAPDNGPRWMFELPFSTPQGSAVAQFEISRDGGGNGAADAQATWRAKFSIDVEPMGPVHAQVALTGARAGVNLWAERPGTAQKLSEARATLAHGLEDAAFAPTVAIRVGAPPRVAPASGRFLDEAS